MKRYITLLLAAAMLLGGIRVENHLSGSGLPLPAAHEAAQDGRLPAGTSILFSFHVPDFLPVDTGSKTRSIRQMFMRIMQASFDRVLRVFFALPLVFYFVQSAFPGVFYMFTPERCICRLRRTIMEYMHRQDGLKTVLLIS